MASKQYGGILFIQEEYVRVTGLQVENTYAKNGGSARPAGIEVDIGTPTSDVRISQNVIRHVAGGTGDNWAAGVLLDNGGGTLKVWNNIIYNWGAGIFDDGYNGTTNITIHDNTVVNCDAAGILLNSTFAGSTARIANNLVQGSTTNYGGGATRNYSSTNLSSDNTAFAAAGGGGAPIRNATVSFKVPATPDYHLAVGDTAAQNQGTDLSADASIAFGDDIDGQLRQTPWDIGADDANGTTAVALMSFEACRATARWTCVAHGLGGGQPRLPCLPVAGALRPLDTDHPLSRPRPGLLGHGCRLRLA